METLGKVKQWVRRHPLLFDACLKIYALAWLRFTRRRAFIQYQLRVSLKTLSRLVIRERLSGGLMTQEGDFFLRMPDEIFLFYNFRDPRWTAGDGQSLEYRESAMVGALEEFIQTNLSNESVYFDVGANNGYFYTLKVAKRHPGCRIHAFEPDQRILGPLRRNILFNGASNVTVIDSALSDSVGAGKMPVQMGASGYLMPGNGGAGLVVDVNVTTLDHYAATHVKRLDMIKIDIEGGEFRFLKGGEHTLRTLRPIVIMELRDELLQRSGASVDDVVRLMTTLHYTGYRVRDGVDALFVPRESHLSGPWLSRKWLEPLQ